MRTSEIGSEFWSDGKTGKSAQPLWNGWHGDKQFFLSGRTALEAIVSDICAQRSVRTAYLPSYCCHTMIEPFLRHKIAVDFYAVTVQNGCLQMDIDQTNKHDITLVMDYFGFQGYAPQACGDGTVILDLTHSLLTENAANGSADYLFASFRKWGAVAGAAIACKRKGAFLPLALKEHTEYLRLRSSAYACKAAYMQTRQGDKQHFLDLFRQAEELLEQDYIGYTADAASVQEASFLLLSAQQRRENAAILLRGLQDSDLVTPLFPTMQDADVPLFVPILVKNGCRDALRSYLIGHDVYCPVHWPLSALHTVTPQERTLYDCELSLVCDQRYDANDMNRILTLLGQFESDAGKNP